MRIAIDALKAGEVVCIFPEGELSRSGILLRLKRGYELIARSAGVPVVPVWLLGRTPSPADMSPTQDVDTRSRWTRIRDR